MRPSGVCLKCGFLLSVVCLLSATASAGGPVSSLSYTGTLGTPQSVFEDTFILTTSDTLTFQTWGFGGGTNAAGTSIPSGGFDPLIALFTGSGPTANVLLDGSNIPLADADTLINPPYSSVGNCPPAGTVLIGVNSDCGDDYMQHSLSVGIYTLILSDANNQPNAVLNSGGTLADGFTDFTGGVFQTCDTDGTCINPNGNFAVDIVSTGRDLTATPEPGALVLIGTGFVALVGLKHFRKRRTSPRTKGATQ
jgi:hypothetical protein